MKGGGAMAAEEGSFMAENQTIDGGMHPVRAPFPAVRLVYALAYAVIAWFVIHLVFALAVVQFGFFAVTGRLNDELKAFNFNLIQYLWELLAFVAFVRDEQPFPFGPFPHHG
jgi:hypothetical protein